MNTSAKTQSILIIPWDWEFSPPIPRATGYSSLKIFCPTTSMAHQEISGPLISRKTLGLPNLRSRKKKHTDVWRVQRYRTVQGCTVSRRCCLEFPCSFVLNCFGHLDCFLSWWLLIFVQTKSRLNNILSGKDWTTPFCKWKVGIAAPGVCIVLSP